MSLRSPSLLVLLLLPSAALAEPADVVNTYADIALAAYQDSLTTAEALKQLRDAGVGLTGTPVVAGR